MKPRFATGMLLVLALAVPVQMLAQQNSKAEKEIGAELEELRTAPLKDSAEGVGIVAKYYAGQIVRIPGYGAILTKAEAVAGYRNSKVTVESLEYSNVNIRINGKIAVATGIETGKGVQMGVPWTGTFRWSRVFVKRDGIWKASYINIPHSRLL